MAKIIQFVPRIHGPRAPLGFRFPAVYRHTGFSWKDLNLSGPDQRYPHLSYCLAAEEQDSVAESTLTPITHLDPSLDDGWIIVTRHSDEQRMGGYSEALTDAHPTRSTNAVSHHSHYQTDEGLFSLLHRPAPKGCENHLLIFKFFDPSRVSSPDLPAGAFWHHIVRSNGELVGSGGFNPASDECLWLG